MTHTFDERLPTPKLDDRRFQDLVDEAKRRVQQRCPEWTDHNVSDPGVTLIETFAWMTDQLLYRLNRVPDLNYVKYLELIGVTLLPPNAARADVTFRLADKQAASALVIPAGTQVSTPRSGSSDQITFSTIRPLPIVPCSAASFAGTDAFGAARSHDDTLRVVCFSDRPQPGDAFLVGLTEPVPSCMVRLTLPCKPGAGGGISPKNPPLVWDARVGDDDGTVSLWNVRTRELLQSFGGTRGQPLRRVAFSPDGHMVASAGAGSIWLRDAHETEQSSRRLDGHEGPVRALSFSPDGRTLASAGDDGAVCLWAVDDPGKPVRRLEAHDGPVFDVAFDRTGRLLASAGADGTVRLRDLTTEGEGTSWDVHEHREPVEHRAKRRRGDVATAEDKSYRRCVLGVGFVHDGRALAAAGDDGTVWVFDLDASDSAHAAAVQERLLGGHRGAVFGVAFSPDGKMLATAGTDGTARLWDVAPPANDAARAADGRRAPLSGHQGPVYDVTFSADGQTLATVGCDWTARLWTVATGEQLQRPLSDNCPVHGVAFHPKGEIVATVGLDGGWMECEVEADGTEGLNKNADVILHVPAGHVEGRVGTTTSAWLRCRVRAHDVGQKPYDKSPVIEGECEAATVGGTVAALNAEIVLDEVVGDSEGVAGQRFPLDSRPLVPMPDGEKHVLVVGDRKRTWNEVPSFESAGPKSRCFAVDWVAGEVVFGPTVRERGKDGEEILHAYGAVPPKGATLVLSKYMTGGGRRGNVKARTLTVLRSPIANVASVENRKAASGGVDGEDIENAKMRAPITLRTANRAVTPEDYEQLAREAAPELARVECIAATNEANEGEARVLVIPKVESDNGEIRFEQLVPTVDMITRIKEYLDERRVIGSRILIAPPHFHGITVAAKLRARSEFDAADVRLRVLAALYTEFSPVSGGRHGNGWEFGRNVLQGDVYAVLQSVHGVDRVDDCRLFEANPLTGERTAVAPAPDVPGQDPHRVEIAVSPYATVFSYSHYVFVEGQ
jgi:WD40 repeat protein